MADQTALTAAQISNALDFFWEDQDIQADWGKALDEQWAAEKAADAQEARDNERNMLADITRMEEADNARFESTKSEEPDWDAINEKHRQDELNLEAQLLDCGFTVGELRRAFRLVAPIENWKDPIHATVDERYSAILKYAIPFMTGSTPVIIKIADGKIRVQARGYYASVGA